MYEAANLCCSHMLLVRMEEKLIDHAISSLYTDSIDDLVYITALSFKGSRGREYEYN